MAIQREETKTEGEVMNLNVFINCLLICILAIFASLATWEYKNSKKDQLELTRSEWKCVEIYQMSCIQWRKKGL